MSTRTIHKMATRVGLLVAGALFLVPSVVLAQRVFVNDVDVTGANMRGTVLQRVESVTFDEEGDIRIVAPGTNVHFSGSQGQGTSGSERSAASNSASSTSARRAAGSYIMTIANPYPGTVPYEVDILINGNHVATWGPHRPNSAVDVTEWMKAGRNVVTFNARRLPDMPRSSSSNEVRIVVGEGSFDGQRASVTRILAGQVYRASDTEGTRTQSVDFDLPAR